MDTKMDPNLKKLVASDPKKHENKYEKLLVGCFF
jgi:hypothetical protein